MKYVLCDLETQSAADLKTVGSQAYLRDKSTRLMSAVFLVDKDIYIWIPSDRVPSTWDAKDLVSMVDGYTVHFAIRPIPPGPINVAIRNGAVFVAHNADNFDRLAWEILVGGPQPDWYDTIHACRANGLPAGLDRASKALGGEGKDGKGSRAMHLLCKAKLIKGDVKYPVGTAELWKQMLQYNIIDVLELKRVFDATGVTEPELLRVHQRINECGIPVDLPLARRLRQLWDELGQQARDEVAELTGGQLKEQDLNSPAKVKAWLARKGFPVASLARAQLEQMLADPDGFFADTDDETAALVYQVLLARQQSVRTAPGKLDRILGSAGEGDRVRNCFVYHGAHTGRWSARELQPHNFPRGLNGLDVDGLLTAWHEGELDLECIQVEARNAGGSTADALGTLMRPVIRAPRGRRLVICDYASVEARCVAWLSRDDAMLAAFAGRDIYCEMASTIFGREVTKSDKDRRYVGKITVLGCGYQMGAKKFAATASLQGCNLEKAGVTGEQCVKAFREQFPSVPRMWKAYDNAFRACVNGGGPVRACRCLFRRDGADVCIKLPSGRELRYRDVKMEDIVPLWGGDPKPTPTYFSPRGFRKVVYGGYLTENISQATCRDLLAAAMMEIDRRNGQVVMHVHDEIVCECDEYDAAWNLELMLQIMSAPPEWGAGFPLAVEGFVSEHYVKNPLPGFPHGKGELGKVSGIEVVKDQPTTTEPAAIHRLATIEVIPDSPSDWAYWSEDEPGEDEEQTLLAGIGGVDDVYAVAKRYGIPPEELRRLADEQHKAGGEYTESRRRLWDYLRERIGKTPENSLFQGDHATAGIGWDEIVSHLLTSNEVYTEAFPFRDTGDASSTVVEGNAAHWLWDFYKAGRPKQADRRERLETTLRRLLDRRREIKREEANVPF